MLLLSIELKIKEPANKIIELNVTTTNKLNNITARLMSYIKEI
jgi:hypothetical protein